MRPTMHEGRMGNYDEVFSLCRTVWSGNESLPSRTRVVETSPTLNTTTLGDPHLPWMSADPRASRPSILLDTRGDDVLRALDAFEREAEAKRARDAELARELSELRRKTTASLRRGRALDAAIATVRLERAKLEVEEVRRRDVRASALEAFDAGALRLEQLPANPDVDTRPRLGLVAIDPDAEIELRRLALAHRRDAEIRARCDDENAKVRAHRARVARELREDATRQVEKIAEAERELARVKAEEERMREAIDCRLAERAETEVRRRREEAAARAEEERRDQLRRRNEELRRLVRRVDEERARVAAENERMEAELASNKGPIPSRGPKPSSSKRRRVGEGGPDPSPFLFPAEERDRDLRIIDD